MNQRILVVDDNDSILREYRKILCAESSKSTDLTEAERALFGEPEAPQQAPRLSFKVTSSTQGESAARLAAEALADGNPFSVAFVDMRMPPGWDGVQTAHALWEIDPGLQIVICSAFSDYSWHDVHERLGRSDQLLLLKKPFDNAEVWQLANALSAKWSLTKQAHATLNEMVALVDTRTRSLQDANQELASEIAQRYSAESRLRHDALHDSLTDLPNRSHFMRRVEAALDRTRDSADRRLAVLFLDVDDFKTINDVFGHNVGDELLVEVATRLTAALSDTQGRIDMAEYLIARLGGDEFVILLDGIRHAQDGIHVAECLGREFAEPILAGGQSLQISISVGIAIDDAGEQDSDALLANADTAMYRAKFAGKARHAVFDRQMYSEMRSRLTLENDLRDALDQGQFELMYQPLIVLESGELHGFEALLRWNHPVRGMVSPVEFIPVAESTGMIVAIGEWVLEEACRQITRLNSVAKSATPLSVNVNVSRRQAVEPDYAAAVERVLVRTQVDRELVNLELTESAVMQDREMLTHTLHELRELGVNLHMDDFGTGLSSLSCLHEFPFDVVKIDKAFVRDGSHVRKYMAIVQAIITLAHNLGIEVTAEGIESSHQAAVMIMMDCDYAQGFLFSKPLAFEDAITMVKSGGLSREYTLDLKKSA